jgi:hypothetical protein
MNGIKYVKSLTPLTDTVWRMSSEETSLHADDQMKMTIMKVLKSQIKLFTTSNPNDRTRSLKIHDMGPFASDP